MSTAPVRPRPLRALHDIPAPAKLNLFLHVLGRRADGYHLLQSAFVLIDWCDTLHLACRTDGRIQRHDVPALAGALPAEDLSVRAARALQQASGCPLGVDIHLDKQLPWGAGLGGGSSDAASTLLALNRLWGLHWPRQRLAEIGLRLGADVPFFIGGHNAFVEGIGEQLTPVTLPMQWLAVVKPPEPIATADIFRSPLLERATKAAIVMDFLAATNAAALSPESNDFGRNDLQPPAESVCPSVTQAARWLEARFGNSRMSGSGSAVFARAGTGEQPTATWTADELPPTWTARLCRSLPRHPLVDWAS